MNNTKHTAFQEKQLGHAPVHMAHEAACAWAEGYNAALEKTAAPELLEAVEEIVEGAIKHQGSSDFRVTAYAMNMVRAAIAKATQP